MRIGGAVATHTKASQRLSQASRVLTSSKHQQYQRPSIRNPLSSHNCSVQANLRQLAPSLWPSPTFIATSFAMTTATDAIAYGVPGFFLVSMLYIIFLEMLKEPYGWSVGNAQVDNGSRVISMLMPTLIALLLKIFAVVGGIVLAVMVFTKSGMKQLQKLAGTQGKRLD